MTRDLVSVITAFGLAALSAGAGASSEQPDSGTDAATTPAIYVAITGNDSFDGRSPTTPLQTIHAGLSRARHCEPDPCVVRVATGTYTEQVILYDGSALEGGYTTDFSDPNPSAWPVVITATQTRALIGGEHRCGQRRCRRCGWRRP